MNFKYVSEIVVMTEGGAKIRFSENVKKLAVPYEKIIGIEMLYNEEYALHESGAAEIKRAFGAENDSIVHKIPKNFTFKTIESVGVLKYGNSEIAPEMLGLAKEIGIAGYWDDEEFVICFSNDYRQIAANIIKMVYSKKAKFECDCGKDFKLLSVTWYGEITQFFNCVIFMNVL